MATGPNATRREQLKPISEITPQKLLPKRMVLVGPSLTAGERPVRLKEERSDMLRGALNGERFASVQRFRLETRGDLERARNFLELLPRDHIVNIGEPIWRAFFRHIHDD